jgi:hypothetical protein
MIGRRGFLKAAMLSLCGLVVPIKSGDVPANGVPDNKSKVVKFDTKWTCATKPNLNGDVIHITDEQMRTACEALNNSIRKEITKSPKLMCEAKHLYNPPYSSFLPFTYQYPIMNPRPFIYTGVTF